MEYAKYFSLIPRDYIFCQRTCFEEFWNIQTWYTAATSHAEVQQSQVLTMCYANRKLRFCFNRQVNASFAECLPQLPAFWFNLNSWQQLFASKTNSKYMYFVHFKGMLINNSVYFIGGLYKQMWNGFFFKRYNMISLYSWKKQHIWMENVIS